MVAKKISFINMKGGVGKTTLSVHVARKLAEDHKQKVLLIDLDPQANASLMTIPEMQLEEHYKNKKTIYRLFFNWMRGFGPYPIAEQERTILGDYTYRSFPDENRGHCIDNTKGYLDIIPSSIHLSSLLRGASTGSYELNKFLDSHSVDKQYDYVFIDCAPTYSILTTLALNVSDHILIPMQLSSLALHGVNLMLNVLDDHHHDFGKQVSVLGIIYTMRENGDTHSIGMLNQISNKWTEWSKQNNGDISRDTFYENIRKSKHYGRPISDKDYILKRGLADTNINEFINWLLQRLGSEKND